MRRRDLFRALLALPFVPLLAKAWPKPAPRQPYSITDIISEVIANRSHQIADNVHKNNVLLQYLRMTPAERAIWNNPNERCRRAIARRRTSPVASRYAQWVYA